MTDSLFSSWVRYQLSIVWCVLMLLRTNKRKIFTINIRFISKSSQENTVHIPYTRFILRFQRFQFSSLSFSFSEIGINEKTSISIFLVRRKKEAMWINRWNTFQPRPQARLDTFNLHMKLDRSVSHLIDPAALRKKSPVEDWGEEKAHTSVVKFGHLFRLFLRMRLDHEFSGQPVPYQSHLKSVWTILVPFPLAIILVIRVV